ncbi:MAG: NYN domain-containing protein [Candidatus Pacebacteria bacterium]|nr:NYN domain-containing protein [Candidatus Paceibacterota bacterium]
MVKLKAVKPKKLRSGCWSSGTDSRIASFIGTALRDESVEKILIFSGDGDFLETLEIMGVSNKKIHLVGVKGSISEQFENYVKLIGGKTLTIEKNTWINKNI